MTIPYIRPLHRFRRMTATFGFSYDDVCKSKITNSEQRLTSENSAIFDPLVII